METMEETNLYAVDGSLLLINHYSIDVAAQDNRDGGFVLALGRLA